MVSESKGSPWFCKIEGAVAPGRARTGPRADARVTGREIRPGVARLLLVAGVALLFFLVVPGVGAFLARARWRVPPHPARRVALPHRATPRASGATGAGSWASTVLRRPRGHPGRRASGSQGRLVRGRRPGRGERLPPAPQGGGARRRQRGRGASACPGAGSSRSARAPRCSSAARCTARTAGACSAHGAGTGCSSSSTTARGKIVRLATWGGRHSERVLEPLHAPFARHRLLHPRRPRVDTACLRRQPASPRSPRSPRRSARSPRSFPPRSRCTSSTGGLEAGTAHAGREGSRDLPLRYFALAGGG